MCDAVQVLIASIRIASGFPALAPQAAMSLPPPC
jgi:hypothetical protein